MVLTILILGVATAAPSGQGKTAPVSAFEGVPEPLLEAAKLVEQLRYEEAVVEYQRYLTDRSRPEQERARALLELGFVHMVLGDEANADARTVEAFTLSSNLTLPTTASPRQIAFFKKAKESFAARPQLSMRARLNDDTVNLVRLTLLDPKNKIQRVLLRHANSPDGPYFSTAMDCSRAPECEAAIPPPVGEMAMSSYYFVEALDEKQRTLTQLSSARDPLQMVIVESKSWYKSPVTWGIAGAAMVGIATLIYFLVPPAPAAP